MSQRAFYGQVDFAHTMMWTLHVSRNQVCGRLRVRLRQSRRHDVSATSRSIGAPMTPTEFSMDMSADELVYSQIDVSRSFTDAKR